MPWISGPSVRRQPVPQCHLRSRCLRFLPPARMAASSGRCSIHTHGSSSGARSAGKCHVVQGESAKACHAPYVHWTKAGRILCRTRSLSACRFDDGKAWGNPVGSNERRSACTQRTFQCAARRYSPDGNSGHIGLIHALVQEPCDPLATSVMNCVAGHVRSIDRGPSRPILTLAKWRAHSCGEES